MRFQIRRLQISDIPEIVSLQAEAFPPPFDPELLWEADHLLAHLGKFPEGQWVAVSGGRIVGSCSNTVIFESVWQAHLGWSESVGGPMLDTFDRQGSTLYGLDVSVLPTYRRLGIGRAFYTARYNLVRDLGLTRYGTACRMPDFRGFQMDHPGVTPQEFAQRVVAGERVDRTLTPLLRYGVVFLGVIESYMDDDESGNAAALLEWTP